MGVILLANNKSLISLKGWLWEKQLELIERDREIVVVDNSIFIPFHWNFLSKMELLGIPTPHRGVNFKLNIHLQDQCVNYIEDIVIHWQNEFWDNSLRRKVMDEETEYSGIKHVNQFKYFDKKVYNDNVSCKIQSTSFMKGFSIKFPDNMFLDKIESIEFSLNSHPSFQINKSEMIIGSGDTFMYSIPGFDNIFDYRKRINLKPIDSKIISIKFVDGTYSNQRIEFVIDTIGFLAYNVKRIAYNNSDQIYFFNNKNVSNDNPDSKISFMISNKFNNCQIPENVDHIFFD